MSINRRIFIKNKKCSKRKYLEEKRKKKDVE